MALLGYEIPEDYLPYMLCNGVTMVKLFDQDIFEEYLGTGEETVGGFTERGLSLEKNGDLSVVTVPEGVIFVLVPCESGGQEETFNGKRGFQLKTQVKLSRNSGFIGLNANNTIISRWTTGYTGDPSLRHRFKFTTNYIARQTVSSISSETIFNVPDSSGFKVGDIVVYEKSVTFYQVIAVSTGTITVDRTIDITGSGADAVASTVDNIVMDGWAFDGRGGVNGLGGTVYGSGADSDGGAAYIPYCVNSRFTAHIINCKTEDGNGGAYNGNELSGYVKISNVFNCEVGTLTSLQQGGAAYGFKYSIFEDIRFNQVYGYGGGVAASHYSSFKEIFGCKAYDSSSNAQGGALYNCTQSLIKLISNNYSEWKGGACAACDGSKAEMVCENKAGTSGCGFYNSDYCEFHGFFGNSGGVACEDCDYSAYYGVWNNVNGEIIASNSIANIIYNDGANAHISNVLESLNIT